MTLWSDGKTSEEIQKLAEVDGNSVAYNLHEDLLCVKEDLAKANERVKELKEDLAVSNGFIAKKMPIVFAISGKNRGAKLVYEEAVKVLNKFAIDKKIEALDDLLEEIQCSVVVPRRYEQFQEPYLEGIKHCIQFIECQQEQLRKREDNE